MESTDEIGLKSSIDGYDIRLSFFIYSNLSLDLVQRDNNRVGLDLKTNLYFNSYIAITFTFYYLFQ